MRKLIFLGAVVLLMALALAADARPPGGEITVEATGTATFGGPFGKTGIPRRFS